MGIDLAFGICPSAPLNSEADRMSINNGCLLEFMRSSNLSTVISDHSD